MEKIKIPNKELKGIKQDVGVVAEMVSVALESNEIAKEDFVVLAETMSLIMLELDAIKTTMPIPEEM